MEEEMNSSKKTARIVGVLYIIGTVAGILSLVFTGPIRNAQDLLASIPVNEFRLIMGALFVLIMGLALAMIPVMMYSILKIHNKALALGYVVFRGALETITYLASVVSWLLLLPLSQAYGSAGATLGSRSSQCVAPSQRYPGHSRLGPAHWE